MAFTTVNLGEDRATPVKEVMPFTKTVFFSESPTVGLAVNILETVYDTPSSNSWVVVNTPVLSWSIHCESGGQGSLLISVGENDSVFRALDPIWIHAGLNLMTDLHLPAVTIRVAFMAVSATLLNVDISGYFILRGSL